MTPPARGRPRKKTGMTAGAAPVAHNEYAWTTADELAFLRVLGLDAFCDRETRESRMQFLAPRPVLLQRYIAAIPHRHFWGDIDAVKVGSVARAMLRAEHDAPSLPQATQRTSLLRPMTHTKNPDKPLDQDACQRLHATYATLKQHEGKPNHPWTAASAVVLGRLYIEAWGGIPTATRMVNSYCLPQYDTIKRLFGSTEAYHAAILEKESGCQP